MKITLNMQNAFAGVFVVFILVIPANNFFEVLAMMRGELSWGAWSDPITPVYIKLMKDFFLFLTVLLVLLKVCLEPGLLRVFLLGRFFISLNLFFGFFVVVSALSFFYVPPELVLVGIRAYWTLLFVYVGACFFRFDEEAVGRVFLFIFIIHFILQCAQFLLGSGYAVFFENRSPGIFIVPTTAGAFSLLAYYFAESSRKYFFQVLAVVSLVFSASTMAILVLLSYFSYRLIVLVRYRYEIHIFLALFLVVFFYFVFQNLGEISGRGDGAYISLYTRLGYVGGVLDDFANLAFGRGMGLATSQAVMVEMEGAVVADNTFTGAIVNLGWVAVLPLFFFVVSSFFIFENKLLFFIFLGFSMISNMFEMSPVVQVLMILLGAHAMRRCVTITRN